MNDLTLSVDGMTCGGCENAVKGAVSRVANVTDVDADHASGRVVVNASGPVDPQAVKAAITDAGFTVVG